MARFLSLILGALWLGLAAAPAAYADVSRFAGEWQGEVVITDQEGRSFSRESYVRLVMGVYGSFELTWTTAKTNEPGSKEVRRTQVSFKKAPGRDAWTGTPNDALGLDAEYRAAMDGNVFVVVVVSQTQAGEVEEQTYRRSIEDGIMRLIFERKLAGKVWRTGVGTLRKLGN